MTNKNTANSQAVIRERREKIWTLLARGKMKGYEIAKELNVSPPTIARDIKFLTAESGHTPPTSFCIVQEELVLLRLL